MNGPSPRQLETLILIAQRPTPPSMRELCPLLGVRSTNVVHGLVSVLERKGLVTRQGYANARAVMLTSAGFDALPPGEYFRVERFTKERPPPDAGELAPAG